VTGGIFDSLSSTNNIIDKKKEKNKKVGKKDKILNDETGQLKEKPKNRQSSKEPKGN